MNIIIRAIGFDLGHTLVAYNNPLNWQSLYSAALMNVLKTCRIDFDEVLLHSGESILTRYNTRINYRDKEVTADIIFSEILDSWRMPVNEHLNTAKEAFFNYFHSGCSPYADTIPVLRSLKEKDFFVGILSDVAYGADKKFTLEDISSFGQYIDLVLTSVDVGYRKPNREGYARLSWESGIDAADFIFVGDEEKDIVGANNAGMFAVLIDRKNTGADYGQKVTVKSLNELFDAIHSMKKADSI